MSGNNVIVREGIKSDCKEIRRLRQELADYSKMPGAPTVDHEIYEKDGFETSPPLFSCYVAEEAQGSKEGERKLVGYALYYYSYSTWNGKKMFLEDLYVSEKYRKLHIGAQLFKMVAKKAVQEGCAYLEYTVLSWNPACKFYERFGAVNVTETEEWNLYRLADKALSEAAQF